MTITCNRCGQEVNGSKSENFTAGYYEVWEGSCWHKYAQLGEKVICDSCMWKDAKYIEDYGVIPQEKICKD